MHRKSSIIVMAFGTLALVGCSTPQDPVANDSKKAAVKADTTPAVDEGQGDTPPAEIEVNGAEAAASGACPADPTWLRNPSIPSEVPGSGSTCNFEQFMWQSMIALVQPTTADPKILEFETWMPHYGIFVEDGKRPTAWGEEPPNGCLAADPGAKPRRLYGGIIKQAGANQPLIDLNEEFVYYSMSVDKNAYDMLTSCDLYMANCAGPLKPDNKGIDLIEKYPNLAFPDGAIELKTAWMVLDEAAVAAGSFYTVPGWIQPDKAQPCRPVTLGLTGIHIVSKTPNSPALIWATFEHRNNAPDCSDLTATPPLGGAWSFYNPDCTDCTTNTYKVGTPAQVCRMHQNGNSHTGTFPGGADCSVDPNQFACQASTIKNLEESSAAITALNANVQGLIQANPQLIDKVWANYELVGNMWTMDKTTPPYLQAQGGSLSAANTSMETFVQNGVAGVSNPFSCFSCHNMAGPVAGKTLPPVGLSHLFHEIEQSGGCDDGSLPAACAPYTNDQ